MDSVNLSDFDGGLVGVIREIMIIGTEQVMYDMLLEKGYTLQEPDKKRMMKNYETYSVCYMKDEINDYYNLLAIARITRGE